MAVMSMPADYHLHTPLCRHASGEPTEYAARARALGFTEIGFSDHSPMPRDDFDHWRMFARQLDEYVEAVRRAQREHPSLTIRLALEVDYLPGQEDWIRELAVRHPWDYLIGSVHYVSPPWAIDDPGMVSEWRNHDPTEVWSAYAERVARAAASGLFDIVGHLDLPKKFNFRPPGDPTTLFAPFFAAARKSEVAIELNTGGLRKDCREIYPAPPLLELAFREGIPITFGSDAHAVDEVGAGVGEAVDLARKIGYTRCCRFVQRRRTAVPF
jgi:histidinol-phosphatase (PHP family)